MGWCTITQKIRVSLDIETACGVGCNGPCEHALSEFRNRVTVIGVAIRAGAAITGNVFQDVSGLESYLRTLGEYSLTGHNLKYDLKTLAEKGLDLSAHWGDDTMLMASVLTEKVSAEYLEWYGTERQHLNKLRTRDSVKHRDAGSLSLKTLAPYFCGVEPFWEPESHDNTDYVYTDAKNTLLLTETLEKKLKAEGSYEFYQTKLLPWTKLLFKMERRGIALDFSLLSQLEVQAHAEALQAKARLDAMWAPAYEAHQQRLTNELRRKYDEKKEKAVAKAKDKTRAAVRYDGLFSAATSKLSDFNLDSPTQMAWLLRDHLKYDIRDFDGEESTGAAVLERLASEGKADCAELLNYRGATKLATAFFPTYRELQVDGAIHATFNSAIVRTGRLSSSRPNLQQVERGIKRIFRARDGYKILKHDESAIEPRLIAYYSNCLTLFDIITKGRDFHNVNTAAFFDLNPDEHNFKKLHPLERDVGKEVGLSILYGSGINRLMESAQKRRFIWTQGEARRKLDRFKELYQDVFRFRRDVIEPALIAGTIPNLFGRPVCIDDPSNIHMQGLNTLIQGSASDLVLNSAHKADKQFREEGLDAHILVLEHDCIIAEAKNEHAERANDIIKHCMTDYNLVNQLGRIPLATEGGIYERWEA